jgi:hypothetical protein
MIGNDCVLNPGGEILESTCGNGYESSEFEERDTSSDP